MRSSSYKPPALSMALFSLSSSCSRLSYLGSRSSFVHVRARGKLPGGCAGATVISSVARPEGGKRGHAVTNSRKSSRRSGVMRSRQSISISMSRASRPPRGRRCCCSSSLVHSTQPPQKSARSSSASKAQIAEVSQTSSTPCRKAATCAATPSRSHQKAAASTNSSSEAASTGRSAPPSHSSCPPTPDSQKVMPQALTYWSKLHLEVSPSVSLRY
mmetsp:Transcript_5803/g.18619  ORF Transcript_5803/g.18619 Transcript_5803/m.18619 type:complete len:215 (-) Transcript_5803:928-1572(-)